MIILSPFALNSVWFQVPNPKSVSAYWLLVLVLAMLLTVGKALSYFASHGPENPVFRQIGESAVLVGEETASLAFEPDQSQPVSVRSTYLDDTPETIHYLAGRDYVLDRHGRIRRTANSRIPDFRANILYEKQRFNHGDYPGYGNSSFFVYVDYSYRQSSSPLTTAADSGAVYLPQTLQRLKSGAKVRIVAYGDSITAGGDASSAHLIFWARWADLLRKKYPNATVEMINSGTNSDTSKQGIRRLAENVIAYQPDLVLLGFGMNDQNAGAPASFFSNLRILAYQALLGLGIDDRQLPRPSPLAENLRVMIDRIRAETRAEIIVFSAFPPNPKWLWSSGYMPLYAIETEQVAREKHCAYANVYDLWAKFAEHKKPEDFLSNNINHPNDFGHWIYYQAFAALNL